MSTLHLDTDTVLNLVSQMKSACDDFKSQSGSLLSSINSMDWISPGRVEFDDDAASITRLINEQATQLQELARRVERAIQQWEIAAASLSSSGTAPVVGGGENAVAGGGGGGAGNEWDNVVREIDPEGKYSDQPDVIEWAEGIYEFFKGILGEGFSKLVMGGLFENLFKVSEAIDVAQASQKFEELSKQLSQISSQYGDNSPQAIKIHNEIDYLTGSTVMETVLHPSAVLIIKQGGKWDELMKLFKNVMEGKGIVGGVS